MEIAAGPLRDLTLIAKSRNESLGEAVAFLIEQFHRSATNGAQPSAPPTTGVAIYATYQGERVEGLFDPATAGLTVTSGALAGTWFGSPSGAAKAVVANLKPGVTPNRSGYDFWFVASTGKTLASIRNKR
ncbi:hypothetical protein [Cryptosporangium sp. NPDC048952]|uniref:hypothetical protein n=1 Tax=Cryptosporangium sp. NPDC048952 TaxID=3363961 RepID=UPI00372109CA